VKEMGLTDPVSIEQVEKNWKKKLK